MAILKNLFKKTEPDAQTQQAKKTLDDLLAPSAISVSSNYLQIGSQFARTLFIVTYPRYLNTNWFSPVINMDRPMDVSIFVHPQDTGNILKQLRDRLGRLEAQAMEEQAAGKVRDPILETAINDIEALRDKLQQGTDRFFELGLYITVYGGSTKELDETESKIKTILDAQLVYSKQATFRMKEGFFSTMPLNDDQLAVHTSLNTEPISSVFPFVSYDLTADKGILYGINTHNNSLVLFDRFNMENANMVVFGKSGGGKSTKGSECVVICDSSGVKLTQIGQLVDNLITKFGTTRIDDELEGVILPDIKVWAFDKNLKGSWSQVTVAARKKAPTDFYRFTTRSGRQITTTGDHNMVTIREGRVVVEKSSEIKKGGFLPLPRQVEMPSVSLKQLNLLALLKNSDRIYVLGAQEIIKKYYRELKGKLIDPQFNQNLEKYLNGLAIPINYFSKIINRLGISSSDQSIRSLQVTSQLKKRSLPAQLPISEALMKIFGYIVAEGSMTDNVVCITNSDPEVVRDIKNSLKTSGINFSANYKDILMAARVFIETAKAIGLNKKSGYKRVPPFIFNTSKKEIAAFIKAYFEGDGTVAHNCVCAVSKSKKLTSDLCYLLYYFGIIARIAETKKRAAGWPRKKSYWKLIISGQDNLKKFAAEINFVSNRKKELLSQLINLKGNTNVDIIPGLDKIFEEIVHLLPLHSRKFQKLSPLKRDIYNPSPAQLRTIIGEVRQIIDEFRNEGPRFDLKLPNLGSIIEKGERDKKLNRKLWQRLGGSWLTMKKREVAPRMINVLKAIKTINEGFRYSLNEIKNAIYFGFRELGLSVKGYNLSLQSALVDRPQGNTSYEMLWDASQYISENYQKGLENINRLEQLLNKLELLAQADLFWDPIEKIQKIQNTKEKYVYDLTVDNEVFLAGQGGLFIHNSYAVKLEILRSLMFDTQVFVIDPENEYKFLSDTVGGTSIKISISSDQHINPFDLPAPLPDESPADVLRSHILNLLGLFKLMLGALTPEEEAILDEAVNQTYALKDITPATTDLKSATPPLMSDLQSILEGMTGTESLAIRIKKYTEGSFAGFLNNPTNVQLDNQLITFSIRDMEEELRPIAMYLVLNFIWTQVRTELKRRILAVDEAWVLMKYEAGAAFLFNIAKRARKYFLGLTTISQDIPDFMTSPFGKPIVTNSSLQLLLKQSTASIELVKSTFNLTEAEKFFLMESRVGHGLFFAGTNHVALRVVASYAEDQIITSDPRQILEIEQAKKELAQTSA